MHFAPDLVAMIKCSFLEDKENVLSSYAFSIQYRFYTKVTPMTDLFIFSNKFSMFNSSLINFVNRF